MIEFSGELSAECKNFMIKSQQKIIFYVCISMAVVLTIPAIILAVLNHWVYSIWIIPLICLVLLSLIKPKGKTLDLIFPCKVIIENESISCEGKKFYYSREFDNVKKVIDYGNWYQIYFYFPHKKMHFVCEKNLLVQGTLEEFEEVFKEKLIKKEI